MHERDYLIRRLNACGQLYLGRPLAGSLLSVIARESGVWEIRLVPAHEVWLHTAGAVAALEQAAAWALVHPPTETDLSTFFPTDAGN